MNLTSLLATLYSELRYTSAPPSATITRLTSFLNSAYRDILATPGIERLRDDVMPVTAYANIARTGLPPTVGRVLAIVDRTNNNKLWQVPLRDLRRDDPAQAFTGGYPLRYSVIGNQAVLRQPATTGLWVVSSSASDTTQKAFTESVVTGGYIQKEITAGTSLNGTTRVQIGLRTDHIEVTKFYLDTANAVGFISLYDASSSGNALATLPIGQTYSRYLALEWFPVQTADTTDYMDYTRVLLDLVNGTDEPIIPADFHDALIDGAKAREYVYLDDTRASVARGDFTKKVAALKSWVLDDGDRIASLRKSVPRWSQLGPMYPAGS